MIMLALSISSRTDNVAIGGCCGCFEWCACWTLRHYFLAGLTRFVVLVPPFFLLVPPRARPVMVFVHQIAV